MKIWNEVEKDAFEYFKWFCRDKAVERMSKEPGLSVFSINGSMIFSCGDRMDFMETCSNELKRVFEKQGLVNQYKFFLLATVEVKDRNYKIEKHKKVWKLLQSKWQLDLFCKGPEIEIEVQGRMIYSSIAEFSIENVSTALEIVSSNSKRFAIIASKKNDILTEQSTAAIFEKGLIEYSNSNDGIDYFNLSIHLCPQGDLVFRWGDSTEEAEIAVVFKSDMFTVFSN